MKGRYGNWELEYMEGDSIIIINEAAGVKIHLCKSDTILYVRDLDNSIQDEIHYNERAIR